MLTFLVGNVASKQQQYKTLGNTQYLVAPVTLIREQVLNGSNGPLLYSAEEIKQVVQEWNGMPVVVNHPYSASGKPLSARSPEVLETYGIGYVYNTRFQQSSKSLVGEVWIDVEKSNAINDSIVMNIEAGNSIEVSTGLGLQQIEVPEGTTFNGEAYTAKAVGYKPDHLAVLPSSSGACSVAQGCGILVNESGEEVLVTHNELSFNVIRARLRALLEAQFTASNYAIYISEVFNKYVVFELYNRANETEILYQLGYTKTKDKVTLDSGTPIEVERKVTFTPVTNLKGEGMPQSTVKTKDDLINGIVANKAGGFEEADRETLVGFSDDQLKRILNSAKKPKAKPEVVEPQEEVTTNDCGCTDSKPVTNEIKLTDLPQSIQSLVANAEKIVNDKRADLVAKLVANTADDKKEALTATLNTKSIEDLEFMVGFTSNAQPQEQQQPNQGQLAPNFFGRGGGTNNQSSASVSDDLEMVANQITY